MPNRLLRLETGFLKQPFVRHSYVCYLYLTNAFLMKIRLIFLMHSPVTEAFHQQSAASSMFKGL